MVRIDRIKKIDQLHEFLNERMSIQENVKVIENPTPGDNCLIKLDDEYVRGRIIKLEEDDEGKYASIFICDFGRIESYEIDEVFETSNEIVEFMSYTAIMGSFSGILENDGDDIGDKIWNMIQKSLKRGEVYAKVMRLKENLDWLPGIYYYELVLAVQDENDKITILNQEFVKKGYAKWMKDNKVANLSSDVFSKELLSNTEEIEEVRDESWEEFVGTHKKTEVVPLASETSTTSDIESLAKLSSGLFGDKEREMDFDDEEMIQMMKMFKLEQYIPIYKKSKEKQESKVPKPLLAIQAPSSSTNDDSSSCLSSEEKPINNPTTCDLLIHTTHQPEVLWQQNDFLVILKIHVSDNQDYHLEIRKNTMIFVNFLPNEETQILVINFFGLIDVTRVSYQIRGLNLLIRLPKRFAGIFWSRLTKEDEKFSHIKYNLETMTSLDEEFEPHRTFRTKVRPVGYNEYFEDEDSDENHEDEVEHDDLDDPLFDGII